MNDPQEDVVAFFHELEWEFVTGIHPSIEDEFHVEPEPAIVEVCAHGSSLVDECEQCEPCEEET